MYNLVIFMHIKEIMTMIKKNLIKKMPCGINISPCLIIPSAICQKSQIYDIFELIIFQLTAELNGSERAQKERP